MNVIELLANELKNKIIDKKFVLKHIDILCDKKIFNRRCIKWKLKTKLQKILFMKKLMS